MHLLMTNQFLSAHCCIKTPANLCASLSEAGRIHSRKIHAHEN